MRDAVSLTEATLWLWPETALGAADLANPIWSKAPVNSLRMDHSPIVVETRPTGAAAPRRHILTYLHSIGVGHVLLSQDDRLPTPLATGRMVLQVTWFPETWVGQSRGTWMRRVFKGVTVESDSENDREGVAIERETKFVAESAVESFGTGEAALG